MVVLVAESSFGCGTRIIHMLRQSLAILAVVFCYSGTTAVQIESGGNDDLDMRFNAQTIINHSTRDCGLGNNIILQQRSPFALYHVRYVTVPFTGFLLPFRSEKD